MAAHPTDSRALVAWLTSAHGPPEFVQCVETALADVDPGAGSGAAANKDTAAFRKAKVWKQLRTCTFAVSKYTIGDAVYSADKEAWWDQQGVDMVEEAVRGIRIQQGGSKVAPTEVAGKLLTHAECVALLGQGAWQTFATNIEAGDLAGAITALGAEGLWPAMILRAFTCFKDVEGAVVPSKEWERQQVMKTLQSADRLLAEAIEGEITTSFPAIRTVTLEFVDRVRRAISKVDDPVAALCGGMAAMLECTETQLDQMNWAAVSVALSCTLTVWGKMMGPHIGGAAAVNNVPGPLREWALSDGSFARWPDHCHGQPAKPMSLLRQVVLPRLRVWMVEYWKYLRTGKGRPAQTLGAYFGPDVIDYDREYRLMGDALAKFRLTCSL